MLALLAAFVTAASPPLVPPALARLLASGRWDATPQGFRVMTLSFVADGCAERGVADPARRADALACVQAAARQVEALPAPRPGDGLFLAHRALVWGARDALGPCEDPLGHRALVEQLVSLADGDPLAHVSSYAGTKQRWPADHAAALAAIARYDTAHGTRLLDAPLARWRTVVLGGLHPGTQLPRSDVATRLHGGALPRGCAQSLLTRYLLEVDPALAHAWWQRYRARFLVRHGPVVGLREWPPGVERRGDVDSGPIILGIGVAASGLGIAAARGVGDEALARALEASADTALEAVPALEAAAGSLVARAVRFQATAQPVVPAPPEAAKGGAPRGGDETR